MADRLEDVFSEFLALHVFEHASESRMHFLRGLVFYLTIVKVLDVGDFDVLEALVLSVLL